MKPSPTRLRAKPAVCRRAYEHLFDHFGPQHWWPSQSPAETIIGAVLTQNTSWKNVALAIEQLREADALDFHVIAAMEHERLADLIRQSGYYNLKARRLRAVAEFFIDRCDGDRSALDDIDTADLRDQLLAVNGIGPETADSILLYALERRAFVVDAYTMRVGRRHGWFDDAADYAAVQSFLERSLPNETTLYNEFHALIVRVGNAFCRPKPRCEGCPLNEKRR